MRILPIASGKGGVGKSLVAANLSLALARAGKRVIAVDADLGGSNLHLILGVTGVRKGIGTFLSDTNVDFQSIILETEYKNLSFIPGDAEIPGTANLKSSQKGKLIRRIKALDADYVVLDLGAGTNFNTIDFFLTSGKGLIVTSPTPTANLNAYLFVKNVIFRILNSSLKKGTPAYEYMLSLMKNGTTFQQIYMPKLIEAIKIRDPASYRIYRERLSVFQPKLILNMIEDPKDGNKAKKLRRSCKEYLGVDMEHMGIIYRDDLQDIALQSRLPILVYKPNAVLSQAIYRISDKILQLEDDNEEPLDFETLDESYNEADMEAEVDYETKIQYMEDLLHAGALTEGDLIETIKMQQYELTQLKKENSFLKMKIVKAMEAGFTDK